jgi:hypothetical protein
MELISSGPRARKAAKIELGDVQGKECKPHLSTFGETQDSGSSSERPEPATVSGHSAQGRGPPLSPAQALCYLHSG